MSRTHRNPVSTSVADGAAEPAGKHASIPLSGCLIHSPISPEGITWLNQTVRCNPDAIDPPAGTFDVLDMTIRVTTFDDIDVTVKIASKALGLSAIAAIGLRELLVNAVEHGNLGITFDEKSKYLKSGKWQQEIERRLTSDRYRDRFASVLIRRDGERFTIDIADQGPGFDWQAYLDSEETPSTLLHGRGVSLAMGAGFTEVEFRGAGNEVFVSGVCDRT